MSPSQAISTLVASTAVPVNAFYGPTGGTTTSSSSPGPLVLPTLTASGLAPDAAAAPPPSSGGSASKGGAVIMYATVAGVGAVVIAGAALMAVYVRRRQGAVRAKAKVVEEETDSELGSAGPSIEVPPSLGSVISPCGSVPLEEIRSLPAPPPQQPQQRDEAKLKQREGSHVFDNPLFHLPERQHSAAELEVEYLQAELQQAAVAMEQEAGVSEVSSPDEDRSRASYGAARKSPADSNGMAPPSVVATLTAHASAFLWGPPQMPPRPQRSPREGPGEDAAGARESPLKSKRRLTQPPPANTMRKRTSGGGAPQADLRSL